MKEQITKSCVMTYCITRYNGYHLWTKSERTTVGFVQVRREVVAIGSSAYPGFCSGLTNIAKHWF